MSPIRAACVAAATLFLAAVPVSTASAATLHVDIQSLGGPCSDARTDVEAQDPATPWCTVGKALAAAPGGGVVEVRAGTYPAASASDRHPGAEVQFVPASGEKPILTRLTLTRSDLYTFTGLVLNGGWLTSSSFISFVGDEMTKSGLFADRCTNLRYEGNVVHDAIDGLVVKRSSDVAITHNVFRDLPRGRTTAGGDGLQASAVTRVTIASNTFLRIYNSLGHSDSIELLGVTTDVTLDGNVFHLVRGFIYSPATADGRLLHLTATNNELTNVQVWAFNLAGVPDATLVNNTVWNAGHGVQLRGANTRVALYDNIVSVLDRATGTVTGEDYNLIATGPEIGSHDLRGDPLFVNPSLSDYHLAAGSRAIDAGWATVAPPLDLEGHPRVAVTAPGGPAVPDLGAYEYQPPAPGP